MDRKSEPSITSPLTQGAESTVLFAAFRLEPDGNLFRGETPIHLPPRELGALRLLLANAGQIVTPSQIKHELWGEVHVTAESVPRCLSSLRARLEPDDCIQTVYKRGYRLIAEVHRLEVSMGGTLPRLAIVPFSIDTGVPEHLGVAVAEETIARLSNSARPTAALLARDSVFTLSSTGLTALETGRKLRADLVLAGTVRGLLSHFRLRAEMIRVKDGVQIWVEDLLVERDKSGGLEAELTSRLEARMQTWPLELARSGLQTAARSSAGEQSSPNSNPPTKRKADKGLADQSFGEIGPLSASAEDLQDGPSSKTAQAHDAFLRGHYEWQTLERHRMQDGMQHLTRAIELDPSLNVAREELVHLCVTQAIYGFMAPAVSAELVHRTADSVPELPRQAERILPALGWVNFHFDRNLAGAFWAFSRSAHLPHDRWTTRARAMFLLSRRHFGEAIALLRAAIAVDPYAPWLNSRLAWALHLNGQTKASLSQVEICLRLFPDHEGTALYGSQLLAFNGEPKRAVELAQGLAHRQPYFDLATSVLANALACAGRTDEAAGILERLQWLNRERFVLRSFNAAAYLALGDKEAAVAELEAANEARCPWFFQALADPRLKPLRGLAGYRELEAILPQMEAGVPAKSGVEGSSPRAV